MNGVKQGAVLSPISLAIYSDDLRKRRKHKGVLYMYVSLLCRFTGQQPLLTILFDSPLQINMFSYNSEGQLPTYRNVQFI